MDILHCWKSKGLICGEPREVEKAAAVHPEYGRVFIVGRQRGGRVFHHLRVLEHRLETDGVFTLDRLRHV